MFRTAIVILAIGISTTYAHAQVHVPFYATSRIQVNPGGSVWQSFRSGGQEVLSAGALTAPLTGITAAIIETASATCVVPQGTTFRPALIVYTPNEVSDPANMVGPIVGRETVNLMFVMTNTGVAGALLPARQPTHHCQRFGFPHYLSNFISIQMLHWERL
jgi:hypothetical protein